MTSIKHGNDIFDPFAGKRRVRVSEDELRRRLEFYEQNTEGFEATDEHLSAMMDIFHHHRHLFLTGSAGTGKTTFVKTVVMPELDYRNLHWSVTASTGIAGSHLNGKTVNSFFGIRLGPDWRRVYTKEFAEYYDAPVGKSTPCPQDMCDAELEAWYGYHFDEWSNSRAVRYQEREGVKKRLKSHEVILVDEVSMLPGDGLLGYLEFMLRNLRDDPRPFGGAQMVFIGDFAQLPPVDLRSDSSSRPDWAFMSRAWDRAAVKPAALTKAFRQGDPEFIRFLDHVRVGNMTSEDRAFAAKLVRTNLTAEETRNYTFLVPLNEQAQRINTDALQSYPGPTRALEADFYIVPELQSMSKWEAENAGEVRRALIEKVEKHRLVKRTTFLRIGMPVMTTVNDPDGAFVNGTRGYVREINIVNRDADVPEDLDTVVVGVPDPKTGEERNITLRRWPYSRETDQDPFAKIVVPDVYRVIEGAEKLPDMIPKYPVMMQFPLIPAAGITIHKCVDKSTRIPTVAGIMSIADICSSGDNIPKVHGLTGVKEATEPFIGVVELGYRVTTRRGYSLVCSERHPLLRAGDEGFEWVKAPELRVGDKLRMRGNTQAFGPGDFASAVGRPVDYYTHGEYRLPSTISVDLAWLMGALVGDGCQSDKRDARVDITSMDWCVLTKFADIMKSEFGLLATLKPRPTSAARTSYVHNWGVRRWLLGIGLSHATAPDKRVPEAILQGSRDQQVSFLRGYFDADGGVNTAVHVTSVSRALIGEVHLMLLNLGIVGTIANMKGSWRINITGADIVKFRDIVGFSVERKMTACCLRAPDHRKVTKVQSGFYPKSLGMALVAGIRAELRSVYPHPQGLFFGDHQHWAWFLSRSAAGRCHVSDAHFASMQRDLPLCVTAGPMSATVFSEAEAGCFLDEIVSIAREYGDMRDICVPDGHAFAGNGFVNHNSQGLSMDCGILALSRTFAAGHVYVGLSRLRSTKNLILTDENFVVRADPHVLEYYRSIKENARNNDKQIQGIRAQ